MHEDSKKRKDMAITRKMLKVESLLRMILFFFIFILKGRSFLINYLPYNSIKMKVKRQYINFRGTNHYKIRLSGGIIILVILLKMCKSGIISKSGCLMIDFMGWLYGK